MTPIYPLSHTTDLLEANQDTTVEMHRIVIDVDGLCFHTRYAIVDRDDLVGNIHLMLAIPRKEQVTFLLDDGRTLIVPGEAMEHVLFFVEGTEPTGAT